MPNEKRAIKETLPTVPTIPDGETISLQRIANALELIAGCISKDQEGNVFIDVRGL